MATNFMKGVDRGRKSVDGDREGLLRKVSQDPKYALYLSSVALKMFNGIKFFEL